MSATLASIHLYPLKSCAPLARDSAEVEVRGLRGDRRWMVVDAQGKFLTGRQQPKLTLIRAEPDGDGVQLAAPDRARLRIDAPPADGARLATAVWDDPVAPLLAPADAQRWISDFLGADCRIVYMDTACQRPVDADYGAPGDVVSLADGYPLLLVSQAAVDALNARLAQPVPALRFRPNLVIAGTEPHAEDGWKRVRIGACEFDVVKPCTRCVFTTVDFERGAFDPSGEPLRTLKSYRRSPTGITFGQNLIPRRLGSLRVGDAVEVLG
ncbi:MAG TPA: MOSC N-terminal beta barrel domain-containing protein [Rudaea sp.]|nr:MOSC N-terminal beta barrel domain-containing protein [Rudaea sp.]